MGSIYDELEKKLQDSNATPISLPLDFLKSITRDFSSELELGRGGYGVVYKGFLPSGKVIAVKKFFEIHMVADKAFQNEVSSLKEIKHRHVVHFIGYCAETSFELKNLPCGKSIWAEIPKRLLCFEYAKEALTSIYPIIKGICSGLNFLHEECHMVHLDLKPENILMDATMAPKIADFGLSQIFENNQSRIITDTRVGSLGYMAPEYINQGIISMKADIFSLGVIMIGVVTDCRYYPYFQQDSPQSSTTSLQQFTEQVVGSWRKKFESTLKYISKEKYNLQVKLCIAIALKCVDPSVEKRPTAKNIVQVLSAADQMEAREELPSKIQCKDKSFVLNSTVTKELVPHSITEDMLSNDCKLGDVKKWLQELSLTVPLWEMKAHKDFSPDMPCMDKLLILNNSASKELTPPTFMEYMLNNKTEGKVMDGTTSDGFSPTLSLESSTDNQHFQQEVKESNEPQLAIDTRSERGYDCGQYFEKVRKFENAVHNVALKAIYAPQGETTYVVKARQDLPLYMQFADKLVVNTVWTDSTPHSVTEDMFINTIDGKFVNGSKSDEVLSPTLSWDSSMWDSSMCNQYFLEGAKDSSEPQSACYTAPETEVILGSSTLLDVYPLELHFYFEPNQLIPCSLELTNNTSGTLVFVLMEKTNDQSCFLCLPFYGIIGPRSTYTLVVTTNKHEILPEERNIDLILQSSKIGYYPLHSDAKYICTEFFKETKELGNTVHKVALRAVCAPQGAAPFETIPPLIKIISVEDTDLIHCVDSNHAEPLIVTGSCQSVHMQNYDLQKSVGSVEASRSQTVHCVKFIERKRWLVAGTSDGLVHVYKYEKKMEKITSFEAHSLRVCSLAVHPAKPYVLSGSYAQIKLWDWDQAGNWRCIQTFKEHWGYVCGVTFIPEDTNSFASFTDALNDHTIQVWSLDSPEWKYNLSGHSHNLRCLDFFTRDGQQYLVTGSSDKTAKIWDMRENKCAATLSHKSAVLSVVSHPNLPVLVTGAEDGHVYLWSYINFRLKRILNIGVHSEVKGLACLMGSGRVAVVHSDRLSVIKIRDENEQGDCGSNNENSVLRTGLGNSNKVTNWEYSGLTRYPSYEWYNRGR